jgi:hypothetical protein
LASVKNGAFDPTATSQLVMLEWRTDVTSRFKCRKIEMGAVQELDFIQFYSMFDSSVKGMITKEKIPLKVYLTQ